MDTHDLNKRRTRRVSKSWQRFLETKPRIWRHLDLSTAKKLVSKKFISTCNRCSKGMILAATLKCLPKQLFIDSIYTMTTRCRDLQYLRCMDKSIRFDALRPLDNTLEMSSQLTTIIIDDICESDNVYSILNYYQQLETAEFRNIVKELHWWRSDFDIPYLRLRNLALKASNSRGGYERIGVVSCVSHDPLLK